MVMLRKPIRKNSSPKIEVITGIIRSVIMSPPMAARTVITNLSTLSSNLSPPTVRYYSIIKDFLRSGKTTTNECPKIGNSFYYFPTKTKKYVSCLAYSLEIVRRSMSLRFLSPCCRPEQVHLPKSAERYPVAGVPL